MKTVIAVSRDEFGIDSEELDQLREAERGLSKLLTDKANEVIEIFKEIYTA